MANIKHIFLVFMMLVFVSACQSFPKNAPKCKGKFTAFNTDYSDHHEHLKQQVKDAEAASDAAKKSAQEEHGHGHKH